MHNALVVQFSGALNKSFTAVLRIVIHEAKGGDMTAARLLLDRAIPARKAVEHYGAQDGNNIGMSVKGRADINLNRNDSEDAEYGDIDNDVQTQHKQRPDELR